ncbi:MAG: hypothetical protein ABSF80_09470 [Chitinispirillaceae bacterium]|jgi:hypothetical protein
MPPVTKKRNPACNIKEPAAKTAVFAAGFTLVFSGRIRIAERKRRRFPRQPVRVMQKMIKGMINQGEEKIWFQPNIKTRLVKSDPNCLVYSSYSPFWGIIIPTSDTKQQRARTEMKNLMEVRKDIFIFIRDTAVAACVLNTRRVSKNPQCKI